MHFLIILNTYYEALYLLIPPHEDAHKEKMKLSAGSIKISEPLPEFHLQNTLPKTTIHMRVKRKRHLNYNPFSIA